MSNEHGAVVAVSCGTVGATVFHGPRVVKNLRRHTFDSISPTAPYIYCLPFSSHGSCDATCTSIVCLSGCDDSGRLSDIPKASAVVLTDFGNPSMQSISGTHFVMITRRLLIGMAATR